MNTGLFRRWVITAGIGVWLVAFFALAAPNPASANNHDTNHDHGDKVWVCKYVDKPGEAERLKGGKNPIQVDDSATNESEQIGTSFADAQGRSVIVAGEDSECPAPTPETTTTVPVTSTTAPVGTTTTTAPSVTSTTIVHPPCDDCGTTVPSSTSTSTLPPISSTTLPPTTLPSTSTTSGTPQSTAPTTAGPTPSSVHKNGGTPTSPPPSSVQPPSSLAFTGSNPTPWLALALLSLLVGVGLVFVGPGRKRA